MKKVFFFLGALSCFMFVCVDSSYAVQVQNKTSDAIRVKIWDDTGYKNYALIEQVIDKDADYTKVNFTVSDDVGPFHVDHDYAPSRINVSIAQASSANYGHVTHINNSGCVLTVNKVQENDGGTVTLNVDQTGC